MNAGWIGIIGPAGMPAAAVRRLEAEYSAAIHQPEVNEKLTELGLDPIGANAEVFAATYARERVVWRDLLAKAGLEVKG
jgi:tripartite-type tricarboxylate transporter receptor subunit TctC